MMKSFLYNLLGTHWSEVEVSVSPSHQPKRLQWKTSEGSIWKWKLGTWGLTTRSSSSTRLFLGTQPKIATHLLRDSSGWFCYWLSDNFSWKHLLAISSFIYANQAHIFYNLVWSCRETQDAVIKIPELMLLNQDTDRKLELVGGFTTNLK